MQLARVDPYLILTLEESSSACSCHLAWRKMLNRDLQSGIFPTTTQPGEREWVQTGGILPTQAERCEGVDVRCRDSERRRGCDSCIEQGCEGRQG
eukprot:6456556-Amphidinium_carterae.1